MKQIQSQRTAYGMALVDAAKEDVNVVALEADLGKSTMSYMMEEAFPDRYFQMGIAEANMAGTAAGLALTGKIPFISTFAVFDTARCYDQIRTSICIANLNVKICGSSAGLSDFGDGASHQSIEDIAIMRVLPNMSVFVPCDAVQTAQIVQYMARHHGPMYLRLNRNDMPILTAKDDSFIPKKCYKMREGSDILIIACGVMVSKSLEAADRLSEKGFQAAVINMPSIKPVEREVLINECGKYSDIIVAEEHSVIGGLASAVAENIGNQVSARIHRIGIQDRFGKSSVFYDDLLREFGLTTDTIEKTALSVLHV